MTNGTNGAVVGNPSGGASALSSTGQGPITLPEIVVTPPAPGPTLSNESQVGAQGSQTFSNFARPFRPIGSPYGKEQATLIVEGLNFQDWESVWVQLRWGEPYDHFRFSSVERDTPAGMFYRVQFLPGETCQINLGGIDVIDGFIETRQVAFDAARHGVEIQGRSSTNVAAKSSVNTTSGSFDGLSFEQVAHKVLSEYPNGVIPIGMLDPTPFDKLQAQKGEMIWDFLERIARPRGVVLSTDSFGNFLLVGDHSWPVINTQLIEGENIKKAQILFHKEHVYTEYRVDGQVNGGSNGMMGTDASEQSASWGGTGYLRSLLITPAEQPVKSIAELLRRAQNESIWHEMENVEATITVQGWFRDNQTLWWPGDKVFVYCPMGPLNMVMKIKNVTFTQDSVNGTETTLDLLQPWALRDTAPMNVGSNPPTATPQGQNIPPIPD